MEGFEKPRSERDVEKDKHAFIEAISNISVEEIQTGFDEPSAQQLEESLKSAKLFLLGETHGVKENVDIIYTLFKRFGFRQLALEWEPELRHVVEKFIETGQLDFDAIQDSPDGRITAGHFALLKKLEEGGLLEEIVYFDGWQGERDASMAKNILARVSDSPMFVVAGSSHTEFVPIVEADKTEHHSMGEYVKKQIPTVPSGKIRYAAGQYHNFGVKDFRGKPKDAELQKAKFYKSKDGVYVFELPEAHAAVVPNPHERLETSFQ